MPKQLGSLGLQAGEHVTSSWKPDVCVYHANCDDGFGAALAVWRKWGDSVEYVPADYGKPLAFNPHNKHVLFVDFSLKRDAMLEFAASGGGSTPGVLGLKVAPASVIVIDHHKTAEAELKEWSTPGPPHMQTALKTAETDLANALASTGNAIIALFDLDRSGAVLTWEFCFPGEPVPPLLSFIEDRDLWNFKISGTAEISAALRSRPRSFSEWDFWLYNPVPLRDEGGLLLRAHQKNVQTFCEQVQLWDAGARGIVPVVNVPYHYASDCADALLKRFPKAPFAMCYFDRGDGIRQFSLRSTNERDDVSKIAQVFGGGGHRNAAGFSVKNDIGERVCDYLTAIETAA